MPFAFQYTDCTGSCSYRVRRGRSAADPGAHSRRPEDRHHHRIAGEEAAGTVDDTAVEEDTVAGGIVVGAEGSWHSLVEEGRGGSHSLAVVEEHPIVREEGHDDLRDRDLVLDTC